VVNLGAERTERKRSAGGSIVPPPRSVAEPGGGSAASHCDTAIRAGTTATTAAVYDTHGPLLLDRGSKAKGREMKVLFMHMPDLHGGLH